MRTIKFSNRYSKFPRILIGKNGKLSYFSKTFLIEVLNVNLEDLSVPFIAYDTSYWNPIEGRYKLPKKGKYMVLMLRTNGELWTTIRRWTPQKEKYYKSLIGQEVKIEIKDSL